MKCPECDYTSSDSEELAEHLEYSHFLDYIGYYENLSLIESNDSVCFKCNCTRKPLTWIDKDFYYLPCRDCITKKSDKSEAKNDILKSIRLFYKRITGDRYFQLFVLDDIYYRSTLPHTYSVFSKVLKSLDLPKDRDDLWFLDWLPGYPKTICTENIPGIQVVNLTEYFKNFECSDNIIRVRDFEIHFPDKVPYEAKHHFRYNILNVSGTRKTKRLRLSTGGTASTVSSSECIKFYNTSNLEWRSIFKVYRNGLEVQTEDLGKRDLIVLKMAIFRTKSAVKLIFEIIQEILKNVRSYRDGIFLKNTILLDPDKEIDFNLSWVPEENRNEFINISIL